MKTMERCVLALLLCASAAAQQQITSPTEAFQAGKDFAAEGKKKAGDKVSSTTGAKELPYYSTTAPETSNYQNGRNLIGAAGTEKKIKCATNVSPNAFNQQECDAVNFMAKNPTSRPKFVIDKKTDPILKGSKDVIANPDEIPGASKQQCRVVDVKTPGTFTTETCTDSMTTEILSCDEKMLGCTVTGRKLECRPVSTTCIAGADSCCSVNIQCAGSAAIIQHRDCCGYSYSKTINSVNDFLSGIAYNPAGARITCDSGGSCSMSFENYECSNPSESIGSYPNANAFNLTTTPIFSCLNGGGCEDLEARTK